MTRKSIKREQHPQPAARQDASANRTAPSTSLSAQILQMQKLYGNRAVVQMMLKRKFNTSFKNNSDSDSESDLDEEITDEFWVSNRDSEDEEEEDLQEQDVVEYEEEEKEEESDLDDDITAEWRVSNRDEEDELDDLVELEVAVEEQETIQLPDFPVDPKYHAEVQRQIDLQMEGINKMTAKQWLVHAIVNRLRSSSKQTELSTTKDSNKKKKAAINASNRLASRLRSLLLKNDQLAELVINGVKERMNELGTLLQSHKLAVPDDITQVIQDSDNALQGTENAYQAFENAEGTHKLERLSQAGLIGGTGRQHGAGDEKEFRNQHGKGIEDLKTDNPIMNKNHILHNPDQCLGGPMEILWNQEEKDNLANAKTAYNEAFGDRGRALLRKENAKEPESIRTAEEHFQQCETSLQEAKNNYLAELQRHVGNGTVNSNLGGLWLQQIGSDNGKLSRFDQVLDNALDQGSEEEGNLDLDKLNTLHLDVAMKAVPTLGLNWGDKGLQPIPSAPKKKKKKQTEKDLLQKEKKALQKALEKLQSIHSVNRQTSILKFTSTSTSKKSTSE